MTHTGKQATEIQQVCSGSLNCNTSRDLTCLYWKRRDKKGVHKLQRDWKRKVLSDTTERGAIREMQREVQM